MNRFLLSLLFAVTASPLFAQDVTHTSTITLSAGGQPYSFNYFDEHGGPAFSGRYEFRLRKYLALETGVDFYGVRSLAWRRRWMLNSAHISEKDLIRFADAEMESQAGRKIERHLQQCELCRRRIEELKSAANAYTEYHTHVFKPSLAGSSEWPLLDFSVEKKPRVSPIWIAAVAAACGFAIVAVFFFREMPHRKMSQLLARASAVQPLPRQRLHVRWNGRS